MQVDSSELPVSKPVASLQAWQDWWTLQHGTYFGRHTVDSTVSAMSMVGVDATFVVIIEKTEQRLKEVGAITAQTARTPSDLGLEERWLKTSANAGAGVLATGDGRYYLSAR